MVRFEEMALTQKTDLVLVYGDVNSTIAAALVCAKLCIPVGHVEAGLRSFDRTMPEEINRILTDQIADILFTPSIDGNENLIQEGIASSKIHLVGNVMIDTLIRLLPLTEDRVPKVSKEFERYGVVTLHRPQNVDNLDMLRKILEVLREISHDIPLIFPMHPRTSQRIQSLNIKVQSSSLKLIDPLGYLDFLALERRAKLVITDSGGIQEETTFLGIPCLTLRENTERPITVFIGTNTIIGKDLDRLRSEVSYILEGNFKGGQVPPLWDGHAGERIADVIMAWGF
jgi:UDP-N-acetylglucosamine 2-epimerase (non-hydrolysing)